MADDGNLRVKISGDASDLGKELVKAEKGLKQFGKSTDQAGQKTKQMGRQLSTNAVPALTSFSQVVQDAPFGIQGVANNITQLTAQFGNLSTASGGAKNALKGMIASLAGPAGILLAISVVTSLLVSYGDEIKNFIFGTDAAKNATEQLNDTLRDQIGLRKQLKDELNIATSIAVAEAKLAGQNAAEQFAVRKKYAEANIKILEIQYDQSLKALKDYHDANQREIAKGSEDEVEAYESLKKDRLDTQKSLNDAIGQLRLDDLNEQIRIQELNKKTASTFQGSTISNLESFKNGLIPIVSKVNETLGNIIPSSEVISDKLVDWQNALAEFNNKVSQLIDTGLFNALSGIGEAIGTAFASGGNVIEAFGKSIISTLGDVLVQFGKLTLAAGIAATALGQALSNPLNPASAAAAIAAGVALIAIGGAVKSFASNSGGGSTDFSSGARGSSGGGAITVTQAQEQNSEVQFRIKGTDLVGAINNTTRRNNSLGGTNTLKTG